MNDELSDNALPKVSKVIGPSQRVSYTLCLQMSTSETVHVLIEVHHLEAVELSRNLLDLFLLARLLEFDAFGIPRTVESVWQREKRADWIPLPFDVAAGSRLVLAICLDCATGRLASVGVVVVRHFAVKSVMLGLLSIVCVPEQVDIQISRGEREAGTGTG